MENSMHEVVVWCDISYQLWYKTNQDHTARVPWTFQSLRCLPTREAPTINRQSKKVENQQKSKKVYQRLKNQNNIEF